MIWIAVITLGSVALLFAVILAVADIKLRVVVNPKIEAINALLPQANCGACGFPGCLGYATAIVEKEVEVNRCAPGGRAVTEKVAAIVGKEASIGERKVARVHCRGSEEAAPRKAPYRGIQTCRAAALVASGDKLCNWGCLGYGDCQRICPFDAIAMSSEGLPVVDEGLCTGCGLCVKECPKNILELHPLSENVMIFCRSQDTPQQSRRVCKNACIACGICVRGCASGLEMRDNLAVVVFPEKIDPGCYTGITKCPTAAIGFVHPERIDKDSKTI